MAESAAFADCEGLGSLVGLRQFPETGQASRVAPAKQDLVFMLDEQQSL